MPRFPHEDPKDGLGAVTSTVVQGRLRGGFFCVHLIGVTLQVVTRPWGGGKRRAGCGVAHGCKTSRNSQQAIPALGRPCPWSCCQGLSRADREPSPQ